MRLMRFFIIVVCIICCSDVALAQLFIEEGKVTLSVRPGQYVSQSLKVHNTSDTPLPVQVYWEDFLYQPPYDGKKKFLPVGVTNFSMGQWVSFSPKNFILPAHGKKEITYSFTVPVDAEGGYYGVMFIEKEAAPLESTKGLSIVARVGCLFFVETEDKIKKGKLTDLSLNASQVAGRIENLGNVILIPEGVYYVMDQEGIAVGRGNVHAMYIPPDKNVEFSFDLNPKLDVGQYSIVLTFDLHDGDVLVEEINVEKDSQGNINLLQNRE